MKGYAISASTSTFPCECDKAVNSKQLIHWYANALGKCQITRGDTSCSNLMRQKSGPGYRPKVDGRFLNMGLDSVDFVWLTQQESILG
jgi:hypothetical protein